MLKKRNKINAFVKKHPIYVALGLALVLLLIFKNKAMEIASKYLGIVKNYYPNLPHLEYKKTTVSMSIVENYISKMSVPKDVKVAVYMIFRNESANGGSGINNNYVGAQADSGKWSSSLDKYFNGVIEKKENMTGKMRLFLGMADYSGSLEFLADRVTARQLYVGGTPPKIYKKKIVDVNALASAYYAEWVTGSSSAVMPTADRNSIVSILNQGYKKF